MIYVSPDIQKITTKTNEIAIKRIETNLFVG